jgi:hypothetical protein
VSCNFRFGTEEEGDGAVYRVFFFAAVALAANEQL